MVCKKCGSNNVEVQVISDVKSRGGHLPLWYYFSMMLPMFDFSITICTVGFVRNPIAKGLKRSADKTKTDVKRVKVCKDCGYSWQD